MGVNTMGHDTAVSGVIDELRARLDALTRGLDDVETGGGMSEQAHNLQLQLEALYAEREHLASELGITAATDVVAMVRNLQNQLEIVYADQEAAENGLDLTRARELYEELRASGERCMMEVSGERGGSESWRIVCGDS